MKRKTFSGVAFISFLLTACLFVPSVCINSQAAYTASGNKSIKVNGLGFLPSGYKSFLIEDAKKGSGAFSVVNKSTGETVFTGSMVKEPGTDFGTAMWRGDFSTLTAAGTYSIKVGAEESYSFKIGSDVYDEIITANLNYFTKQRCGDTTLNWAKKSCHLDDIALGGWHDATDVRKLTQYMSTGITALANALEVEENPAQRAKLIEELKWGNIYFFGMQSEQGFVMSSTSNVPGDNNSQNRWTDNIKGNSDDRVAITNASVRDSQYYLVYGNAKFARLIKDSDPAYYAQLIKFCEDVLKYWEGRGVPSGGREYGPGVAAYTEMYKATGEEKYKTRAISFADSLMNLQEKNAIAGTNIKGFFKQSANGQPTSNEVDCGWEIIGLTEIALAFPDDTNAGKWLEAINLYCNGYVANFTKLNPYGILPTKIITNSSVSGKRTLGTGASYNYFGNNSVGNNHQQLPVAVGLMQAYKLTGNKNYMAMSQKLYDWVLGVNMFNASSVTGFGYNHIAAYKSYISSTNGSYYDPQVPIIQGGVVNGISSNPDRYNGTFREGDFKDTPEQLFNGGEMGETWQAGEYWGPAVAYSMWYECISLSYEKSGVPEQVIDPPTEESSGSAPGEPSDPASENLPETEVVPEPEIKTSKNNWVWWLCGGLVLLGAGAGVAIYFSVARNKKRKSKEQWSAKN